MKRFFAFIVVMLCISLLVAGCSTNDAVTVEEEPSVEEEEVVEEEVADDEAATEEATVEEEVTAYKIGFIVSDPSEGFWKEVLESLQAACEEKGVEFVYQIAEDAAGMRSAYDSLVAQEVDMIVDGYAIEEIALSYAEEAVASGMPFMGVAFESPVEGAYSYGTSNEGLGEFFGEHAAEYVTKEWDGQVDLIVTGNAYTMVPAMASRTDKAVEVLQNTEGFEYVADVEWVQLDMETDVGSLGVKTAALLTSHPDAEHILYIVAVDTMVPNIVTAIEDAGFEDKVMVLSCDNTETAQTYFKETAELGIYRPWYGSIDLTTSTYGYTLLDKIIAILDGEEVEAYTEHTGIMITAENINEYFPGE